MYSSAFSREGLPVIDRRDAGISRREREMYDMIQEELLDAVGMEDREWLAADDIHPYKSLVPKSKSNTVSFPKITKFNTYLLQHYGADIVGELNEMMYDGQLAGVVGVDGFHTQRLTRDKCRIDPRMSFWRRNQIEFIADIVVYLNVSVYGDDYCGSREYTLHIALEFCFDDRISYEFGDISLKQPDRDLMKLDDYLIPVLSFRDINTAAEDLWFEYMPEALRDLRLLNPYRLAKKMGLSVVHHRLHKNKKTRSVLYWFDSEVEITPAGGDDKTPPVIMKIPAGTILINDNAVHESCYPLSVYHECFHNEYHWLFFQLQEMHNNDLRKIRKCRKVKNQGKEPKNPLTILEWEAKQGSRALMMPESIMRPMIERYEVEERKIHGHAGYVMQGIGRSISKEMGVPKYLVRGRMIQLGYWQAQGALNYIQTRKLEGRYITPFMFSRESCPTTSHTFVISPEESFRLYEKNEEYRERLDSGDYVYVEGHLCLNDPAYIIQTTHGPQMTDWANRHIDECCLRFANVYEVDDNYEFHLNSINCDEDYNKHYIDYAAQGKKLSEKEVAEQQTRIIASLPTQPGEALKALMKLKGNVTIEQLAERVCVSTGTVKNWRKEEYRFDPETAIRIIVGLHLPPWISMWFLQICSVNLQFRGLHMVYRNIIVCYYMDTFNTVNSLIEDAGYERMKEQR